MSKIIENPKEAILAAAKVVAIKKGIINLDIRSVAKQSNISIGTVYNYFPTKADLLIEVVEQFWKNAFNSINFKDLEGIPLIDAIEKIYLEVQGYLNDFEENWLDQLSSLKSRDKLEGRKKERQYFDRLNKVILKLIENDSKLSLEACYKDKLAEFIFANMMMMLRKNEKDLSFFKAILTKIIY